ncbi:MAG: zinc dependent phospholipase C family protein [Gemmatimonadales bacterium]
MTAGRMLAALAVVAVAALAFPDRALAWTPGTHVFIGETLLANLHLLPPAVAGLIQAFPFDFLYGSIAPDTSFAKKYVPAGRHSHFWNVGQETFDYAGSDALRAFGLGYLAHLAADTVAHNYFVPRQLLLTRSTRSMGHSYWESRVEIHLTDVFARKAREIILLDHSPANRHLERIISPTLFSVRTNRRIFRGMVRLAHTRSWRRALQAAGERSRWLLDPLDLERHLAVAYDYTVEVLASMEGAVAASRARSLDPSGAHALRVAKRLRRRALELGKLGSPARLLEHAEEKFGVRSLELGFWSRSRILRPWLVPEPELRRELLFAGE